MIEKRLLGRIDRLRIQLDELRPLSPGVLDKLKAQIDLQWTYNSNAIEGSTLTLRETHLILEHGFTIGGKSLREHFEVVNHKEAINYVEGLAARGKRLTAVDIRQMHQLVLTKIDDENAGRFRQSLVRIAGARHVPPEPWAVPGQVDELLKWLRRNEALALHPIERAALAHHRFVAIHPFIDGNGRTGRLLLNLLLFQAGYPPAVIEKVNRRQYYAALAEADEGKPRRLVNLVARACERSLQLFCDAALSIPTKPDKSERWVSLNEAAQGTSFSQEYLSLLARTGKLRAQKRGRNWLTTRAAVREYQMSVRPQKQAGATP